MHYVIQFQKSSGKEDKEMNNKDLVEMILNKSPFIRIRANGNKKSIKYAEILEKEQQEIDLNISSDFPMPWKNPEDFIYHLLSKKVILPENFYIDICRFETELRIALAADPKLGTETTEAMGFIEKLIGHGNFSCKVSRKSVPDGTVLVFKW